MTFIPHRREKWNTQYQWTNPVVQSDRFALYYPCNYLAAATLFNNEYPKLKRNQNQKQTYSYMKIE